MNLRFLLSTELGQKILILIAPFILRPDDFKARETDESVSPEAARIRAQESRKLVLSSLYLTPLAPAVGAIFSAGAILTCLRVLARAGFPIDWLLSLTTAEFILKSSLIIILLGYYYAFSRKLTVLILNVFQKEKLPNWPIAYWFTSVGGLYMMFGIMAWLITGIFSIHLSWISGLIALGVLCVITLFFRQEWRYQNERARLRILPHYQRRWDLMTTLTWGFMTFITTYFAGRYLIPRDFLFGL